MKDKDYSGFVKLDNSVISELYSSKNGKRALLMYSYMASSCIGCETLNTSLSQLISLLDLKISTGSKSSAGEALSLLVKLDLVVPYEDRRLSKIYKVEEIVRKPKEFFWAKVNTSDSDMNYTLIPSKYIRRVVHHASDKSVEDMLTVLSYVCLKTERRSLVSPVMWVGMNTISKDIHITGRKLKSVLDEMLDIKVIYYKKADMTNGKSGNIYGLYENKEWVDNSVLIAESNKNLDARIKSRASSSDTIILIDGDFAMDDWLMKFFDRHSIDCNTGVAKETNEFSNKYGYDKLTKMLGDYNSEILSASNKIGAYRAILRRAI